jgi:hypothetical protein
VTRRIPPALGLVVVIAGVHALYPILPLLISAELGDLPWWVALMVGTAIAQLASGISIAIGSRHARLLVLVWTGFAIATFVFAREMLEFDASPRATASVFVELVGGPAIAWLLPLWVGETPTAPRIPRAHLVSGAHPGDHPAPDLAFRRFDLGVVMFGIGITSLVGSTFTRIFMLAMLASRDGTLASLLGQLFFFAQTLLTGVMAIRAARQLVDPSVHARTAVRGVDVFAIVALGGSLLLTGLSVGYELFQSDLDIHIASTLLRSQLGFFAVGLITPLFVWWYARTILGAPTQNPVAPPPSRVAAAPAWAMLWLAPILVMRVFVVGTTDRSVFSSGTVSVAGAVLGLLFAVAAIATFIAQRASNGPSSDASSSNASSSDASSSNASSSDASSSDASSSDVSSSNASSGDASSSDASSSDASSSEVSSSDVSSSERPSREPSSCAREHMPRAVQVARIASIIALVITSMLVVAWVIAMLDFDLNAQLRAQGPIGPLVTLIACAVTMWWALRRR